MQMQECWAMLAAGQGAKPIPAATTGMSLVHVLKIRMKTMLEELELLWMSRKENPSKSHFMVCTLWQLIVELFTEWAVEL